MRAARIVGVVSAGVVELVDTPDLGSGGASRGGSSPFARTIRARHRASDHTKNRASVASPPSRKWNMDFINAGYRDTQRRSEARV